MSNQHKEALQELVDAIEARWRGETQAKRERGVSPRTEEALASAKKVLATTNA